MTGGGLRLNNQTQKCSAGKMGLELGALGSCFGLAPTPPPYGFQVFHLNRFQVFHLNNNEVGFGWSWRLSLSPKF